MPNLTKAQAAQLMRDGGTRLKIPKHSSWLLFLLGFAFLVWASLDQIMQRRDAMTSVSVFIGLLAFAAAYCVQNTERRLAAIEKYLRMSQEDHGFQEPSKRQPS